MPFQGMLSRGHHWHGRLQIVCTPKEGMHVVCRTGNANVRFHIGVVACEVCYADGPVARFGQIFFGVAKQLGSPHISHATGGKTTAPSH
jgi:hypothetical protein